MTRGTVLVSGTSIAGPALAHWLQRRGFTPTLVERFPERREQGQNVDVRGVGREVLRRTGLEEAVLAHTTGEEGTVFVDDDGRPVATFPAATGETDGATAEVEVLRGRLSALLDDTLDGVEHLYGEQVAALEEGADGVDVTFASGGRRRFDLVVVAEGATSRTRSLVLDDDPRRPLGAYCAYLTVPRTADDDRTWRWYCALQGRSVHLRPDDTGTTRALLSFLSDTRGLDELDRAAQVAMIRRHYRGAGWQTERVLDGLDDESFYFEDLAQVVAPRWSRGRVALTGDAAWCASPVSGMGTTLALTGAYVLAGEIDAASAGGVLDHRAAFARYEQRMRPFVEKAQQLPPGTPAVANPRGELHRRLLWSGMRAVASPAGRRVGGVLGSVAGRWFAPPADAFELPGYPAA